ncbi:hypothetical protein PR202_gb07698 [Eleusine coracana subsp. coracana]|uniref:Uncharacterized protein n=1 Tax=Eleusine coracana subsp. coracana TaxID=191504 RepID=A0AAV5ECU0_ELECO|nr:hypothetical protein PR202_gb07698 [Eleusine coracana subsp. coracana]
MLRRREGTLRRVGALHLPIPGLPSRQGERELGEGVFHHQAVRRYHPCELQR